MRAHLIRRLEADQACDAGRQWQLVREPSPDPSIPARSRCPSSLYAHARRDPHDNAIGEDSNLFRRSSCSAQEDEKAHHNSMGGCDGEEPDSGPGGDIQQLHAEQEAHKPPLERGCEDLL